MTTKTINVRQKQKYDTSTNWVTNNPILLAGEIGVERDTQKIKIGNGTNNWNTLPYISGTEGTKVKVDGNIVKEWNSNTKLDKVTTQDNQLKAYTVENENQNVTTLSSDSIAQTIMYRTTGGKAQVGTPEENDNEKTIANKEYVDNKINNVVKYTEQTLDDTQKLQARTNIGAGTSSFNGSWNELSDKPTIPIIYQETGNNENGVISQKATTQLLNTKANKNIIETHTITTMTELVNKDPYKFKATITLATSLTAETIVELINDNAILFANHCFAIGEIIGQDVTIYAIENISESVILKFIVGE